MFGGEGLACVGRSVGARLCVRGNWFDRGHVCVFVV